MLLKFAGIQNRKHKGVNWAKFVDQENNTYYLDKNEFNTKFRTDRSFGRATIEFTELEVFTGTRSHSNVITFRKPRKQKVAESQVLTWYYRGSYARKRGRKERLGQYKFNYNTRQNELVTPGLVTPLKDFSATLHFVGLTRFSSRSYAVYEMHNSIASALFPELPLSDVPSLQFLMGEEEFTRLAQKSYILGSIYGDWTFKSTPHHHLLILKDK